MRDRVVDHSVRGEDESTWLTNSKSLPGTPARPCIRVEEGPSAPSQLLMAGPTATVGNGAECTLQIDDGFVSRVHVEITLEGARFRVRDLGSKNGTYIGANRITEVVVPEGTRVSLGHTKLCLLAAPRYDQPAPSPHERFGQLVGRSVPMREVFAVLERIARTDASILALGETGTGKDMLARSVHAASSRAEGPFVTIDCGAIAAELAESELFGHVKGAFTDAAESRAGAFERADGGTLFLDEIGELPLALQPLLLRAIETRVIRRVGSNTQKKVDVRVIAGTNRDLDAMVADGEFRSDLYYRLAVVLVELPPLRARLDDLPLLVDVLLRDLGVAAPGPIEGPNLARLSAHDWPGNGRELRNVLQRALASSGASQVPFRKLSFHVGTPRRVTEHAPARAHAIDIERPFAESKEEAVAAFERAYLTQLLAATEGNVTEASRRAKINRRHLYDLLKKYGLRS
jgi:DNA-binding NtrC family response regulator